MNINLWELVADLKKNCEFVELSHDVSPDTPHWSGFPAMSMETLFDYPDGFYVNKFNIVSQYGTHIDAPCHFCEGHPGLDSFTGRDMIFPLCVVDLSEKAAANSDYEFSVDDIKEWETKNGRIPEGSFVAVRTDWYKRGTDLDNCDAAGQKHYPGWNVDTIRFLVEERNIAAIGHEQSDTDPAVLGPENGYAGETYILSTDRYQIELLRNLDKLPAVGAAILVCFPKITNGAGFTARCIGICSKDASRHEE